MTVVVTSLRLLRLTGFFRLSWNGLLISLQARRSPGFVKMTNWGSGYLHYTASLWKTPEDARNFARQGAHSRAMRKMKTLASEVRTYHFEADELPTRKQAQDFLTPTKAL